MSQIGIGSGEHRARRDQAQRAVRVCLRTRVRVRGPKTRDDRVQIEGGSEGSDGAGICVRPSLRLGV